jgi:[ribosomal protein S5]-alanine N-acetyltransferase
MNNRPTLPELIHTDRLVLRRPRTSDVDAVFEYASDFEVSLHMDWARHTDIAQSHAFIDYCDASWGDGSDATWAITLRGDDRMVGAVGVRLEGHKADLGYVLSHAHWGRGIATEASRAVIDAAFALPGISRVWATCSVTNARSARVLEKAGLEREGILRNWCVRPQNDGRVQDAYCYAIVRNT